MVWVGREGFLDAEKLTVRETKEVVVANYCKKRIKVSFCTSRKLSMFFIIRYPKAILLLEVINT